MPVIFRSPLVILPPKYAITYDAIDDGENTRIVTCKSKETNWKVKIQWPIKQVEPSYVFKSKPTNGHIRHQLKVYRMMTRQGIKMKCLCGKVWYPGSNELFPSDLCPAEVHKTIDQVSAELCAYCMEEQGGDVCGLYVCRKHKDV